MLKQWVKHRINYRDAIFTKVVPTFDLCLNTEATNAQFSYCPLSMGPIVGDVLCLLHPERLFLSAYHLGSPGEFREQHPQSCKCPKCMGSPSSL